MPAEALIHASLQLLLLVAIELGAVLGALAFGAAWAVTGVLGFLFASIFARGFMIMAAAQLLWLAANAAMQLFRLEPGTPDASC